MALVVDKAVRRDPTTFIACFAMWALLCGIALVLPGNTFQRVTIYDAMASIHNVDHHWGMVMAVDGLLLYASIFLSSVSAKSTIAALSSVLWMMLGMLMLLGAGANGYFSVAGAFSVWGALGCFMAITQWVHTPED